jgi:hypothetical protein
MTTPTNLSQLRHGRAGTSIPRPPCPESPTGSVITQKRGSVRRPVMAGLVPAAYVGTGAATNHRTDEAPAPDPLPHGHQAAAQHRLTLSIRRT